MNLVAILAAAGHGDRFGQPKQLLDVCGKPLAAWSLALFEQSAAVGGIYVACEADQQARFEALAAEYAPSKLRALIKGGATRQLSVHAALSAVHPAPHFVLVHDGARPLLSRDVLDRVVAAARRCGAAIAAVPVKDTIKKASPSGAVARTLERESLWAAQTPQVFRYELLLAAHAKALAGSYEATDDAALVERLGVPVELVMGGYENIKITTPEDLEIVRALASRFEPAQR